MLPKVTKQDTRKILSIFTPHTLPGPLCHHHHCAEKWPWTDSLPRVTLKVPHSSPDVQTMHHASASEKNYYVLRLGGTIFFNH